MADRALVIVPTYNERFNVARIIPAILAQDPCFEVLVVDDGSPDGTGAVVDAIAANNERVHIIPRESKLGLGTAYIAGFRWALARKYDLIFEMDADFSHDPKFLGDFIRAAAGAHRDGSLGPAVLFHHGRKVEIVGGRPLDGDESL